MKAGMKETIILTLFILFFGLACLQAGYIIRDWEKDDTKSRMTNLEDRIEKIHGEFIVEKGPPTKLPHPLP